MDTHGLPTSLVAPNWTPGLHAWVRQGTDVTVAFGRSTTHLNLHFIGNTVAPSALVYCCGTQWHANGRVPLGCGRCGGVYSGPTVGSNAPVEEILAALLAFVGEDWFEPLAATVWSSLALVAVGQLLDRAREQGINGGYSTPQWKATVEAWGEEFAAGSSLLVAAASR